MSASRCEEQRKTGLATIPQSTCASGLKNIFVPNSEMQWPLVYIISAGLIKAIVLSRMKLLEKNEVPQISHL